MGLALAALPQVYINYRHYGAITLAVRTDGYGGSKNLYFAQLRTGLMVQRYETYVGPAEGYPSASVTFFDTAGRRVIDSLAGEELTLPRYFSLFLSAPAAFFGIYGRHLINLLDHRFPEGYIYDLFRPRPFLTALNFALWFAAGLSLFISRAGKQKALTQETGESPAALRGLKAETGAVIKALGQWGVYCLIVVLPSFTEIPGAIEIRFFLPVYITMYAYLCFFADFKKLAAFCARRPVTFAASCLTALVVFCSVTGSTMALIP